MDNQKIQDNTANHESFEHWIKEYELTQQMAMHYDTINWQIGSIMCVGIFVALGVIGTSYAAYLPFSILSLAILLMWNQFYKRHRKIQQVKWERLQYLEGKLNFNQHLDVAEKDNKNQLSGLKSIRLVNVFTFSIPLLMLMVYFFHKMSWI